MSSEICGYSKLTKEKLRHQGKGGNLKFTFVGRKVTQELYQGQVTSNAIREK